MIAEDRALDAYIEKMSTPEDPLLAELRRATNLRSVHPQMLSGHIQGKFLEFLTRMINPRRVLEISTFTGYSTLCIAAGLADGGIIDTIEVKDELQLISQEFFDRSSHRTKIRQHIGSALEIAPQLGETYDMVFIDGDKREYPAYYSMLLGDSGRALVRSGSVVIADNILWWGKVADTAANHDPQTLGIESYNKTVRDDPRVDNLILPVRDGLSISMVK